MSRGPDGTSSLEPRSVRPELLCVVVSPEEAERLSPLIDRHRKASGVCGLLGAVTQSFDAPSGAVVVQLQLLPLNRRIAALLNRAARQVAREA